MGDSVPRKKFAGFSKPQDVGFTRVPNDFIENELANITSLAELKIILYLMRHTWGFQEYDQCKKLSLDEFAHGRKHKNGRRMDKGTGLGMTATKDGIKRAIKDGYIVSIKDDSDKGRIKIYYWLNMPGYKYPGSENDGA
jgi:hypothetical protein